MVRRKKVVCKLGLLHHPMTLASLRKTESGTRLLRKLQLPAMWETSWKNYSQSLSLQCPWKARGCVLCIYPGSFPSWTNALCTLPVQSFTLPYICYSGALPLKNCPSSPRRQLQGSAGWNDDLVNVCQHSEGTGDMTSKGTSGIFCSGLHEVAVKGGS